MEPAFDQSSIANTLRKAMRTGTSRSKIWTDQLRVPKELQTRPEDLPKRLRGRSAPQPPARRFKPLTAAQRAPQDTPKHLPRPDPNPNSDTPF